VSPGNTVRLRPGPLTEPGCLREARADRLGTVELEPLLWRFPPLPGARWVVARDLGPLENARVIRAWGRRAWVLVDGPGGTQLLDYDDAIALLWGGATARAVPVGPVTGGE